MAEKEKAVKEPKEKKAKKAKEPKAPKPAKKKYPKTVGEMMIPFLVVLLILVGLCDLLLAGYIGYRFISVEVMPSLTGTVSVGGTTSQSNIQPTSGVQANTSLPNTQPNVPASPPDTSGGNTSA